MALYKSTIGRLLNEGRPIALVAEDNVYLRENTVRMLDRRGIASIPVGSYSQAASALSAYPKVDVALLDIHLHLDKELPDKGGIAIARLLRSQSQRMCIIGYSGRFREAQLAPEEISLFSETHAKGDLNEADHKRLWDLTAKAAQDSYRERWDSSLSHLSRLRRLYEGEFSENDILERIEGSKLPSKGFTAEGELGLAGYRIKALHFRDWGGKPSRSFLIWEQRAFEDGQQWTNIEVYGLADLYGSGKNEAEAVESLRAAILMTQEDIEKNPEDKSIREFIDSLNAA